MKFDWKGTGTIVAHWKQAATCQTWWSRTTSACLRRLSVPVPVHSLSLTLSGPAAFLGCYADRASQGLEHTVSTGFTLQPTNLAPFQNETQDKDLIQEKHIQNINTRFIVRCASMSALLNY